MAARQGISGQLTQYGDDAKRSFISSAPPSMFGYRWFSNMNTTCTIKSAPPRTPEVMSMLANKHGWLVKRNEQGVWQRRYCCVVPHTFLYYFDTEPGDNNHGDGDEPNFDRLHEADSNAGAASSYAVPVGIIDMECYTTVDRLSENENIIELKGDSVVNPDLRSFFFKGESRENCEEWTTAFLSDRHQALRDEREALKEVCDTFPLQLANMANMIKEAEAKADEKERESYRIRSSAEEGRQQILELVREGLEGLSNISVNSVDQNGIQSSNKRTDTYAFYNSISPLSTGSTASTSGTPNSRKRTADGTVSETMRAKLREHQAHALAQLDTLVHDQSERLKWMGGTPESVSVLVETLYSVAREYLEMALEKEEMARQINLKSHNSKSDYNNLEQRFKDKERLFQQQEASMKRRASELEDAIKQLKKENSDLAGMLQNSQMELKIHSKKTKTKLMTLQEHKKILKKEVIDLRATLEEVKSDLDLTSHQKAQLEGKLRKEKTRRTGLKENYKMLREQLAVQERAWGMMQSSIAGGSVVMNGYESGLGDQSVMEESVLEDSAGRGGRAKKISIPGPHDSTTQNLRSPSLSIGVTNVGFHPRDVVVKRKIAKESGENNDDGSKGSRGSWSGKSPAGNDAEEDSHESSDDDDENERAKAKGTDNKTRRAPPPRHPNSTVRSSLAHNRRISRSDMSVMSEITTDREISTTAYDDGGHGDHFHSDSFDENKPSTIVIDNDIDLHDGNFDQLEAQEHDRATGTTLDRGGSPKRTKKPPLMLQTIHSGGDDSQATNTGEAIRESENPSESTERTTSSPTADDGTPSPHAPKISLQPGMDGRDIAPKVAQSHAPSMLPPIHPTVRGTTKDPRRNLDRPPSRIKTNSSTLTPNDKMTLDDLLQENDDISLPSIMSEIRKHDTPLSSLAAPGEPTAGTPSGSSIFFPKSDDDNVSVASAGSNASRLSVAERARLDAESRSNSMVVLPPQPSQTLSTPRRPSDGSPKNRDLKSKGSDLSNQTPSNRTGGWISKIGSRLVDRIDNSVLGVNPMPPQEQTASSENSSELSKEATATPSTPSRETREPPQTMPRRGSLSSITSLNLPRVNSAAPKKPVTSDDRSRSSQGDAATPLRLRQQQQREKQMQFLRERGLLK